MPRDILSDSLAVLRIVEHEDEENWPLEEKVPCKASNKKTNNAPSKEQTTAKDDCACYYNYALGDSAGNRQNDPIYQYKTSSLPAASSINQSWDDIVCSALRLSPEDIANQLSLLDLSCFKAIRPEELTSCGWNKANKLTVAPNVVAFTKRFNRVSFWTVQEILNGQTPKARAETIVHFIKVAKKLHELNNLHSLFAVVSALNSSSIYRLTKTWACVPKKDKQVFDKMAELFGEKDNWMALREYLRSISLPCIPHLGIFLTDLVYIDMAHPASSGSPHRATKMAVVLKALERYQASEYDMAPLPHVANYLNSVRYIEELQKFLEDDQFKITKPRHYMAVVLMALKRYQASKYDMAPLPDLANYLNSVPYIEGLQKFLEDDQFKLSQKLEPDSPVGSCAGSKESVKEALPATNSAPFSLSPSHRLGSGSLRLQGSYQAKFIPTHRKCRSLGSNIFGKGHADGKDGKTPAGSVNLLDDTLLESPGAPPADTMSQSLPLAELSSSSVLECDFQSCVRRKTILKEGRKISLSSWQRYWLQLSGDLLIFYASKTFKGTNRSDFRLERCKVLPLHAGWRALWQREDAPDAFQLIDHQRPTIYKFKTTSETTAKLWVAKINDVTDKMVKPLPANLMSFE